MDTQRQIRFGELIRSLLSDCLLKEDFFDDNINSSSITISFVRMSKDLKIANVYFMPLGGKDKIEILEVLKDMVPHHYIVTIQDRLLQYSERRRAAESRRDGRPPQAASPSTYHT